MSMNLFFKIEKKCKIDLAWPFSDIYLDPDLFLIFWSLYQYKGDIKIVNDIPAYIYHGSISNPNSPHLPSSFMLSIEVIVIFAILKIVNNILC